MFRKALSYMVEKFGDRCTPHNEIAIGCIGDIVLCSACFEECGFDFVTYYSNRAKHEKL